MSSSTAAAPIPVPPNVLVHVFPNPGKESRVEELIAQASDQVRLHEPYISLYRYYRVKRDVSAGADQRAGYIIVFLIDDPSRLPARAEMPHHQAIANAIREEDLLRAPLKYLVLEDMGFWKR